MGEAERYRELLQTVSAPAAAAHKTARRREAACAGRPTAPGFAQPAAHGAGQGRRSQVGYAAAPAQGHEYPLSEYPLSVSEADADASGSGSATSDERYRSGLVSAPSTERLRHAGCTVLPAACAGRPHTRSVGFPHRRANCTRADPARAGPSALT